MDLYDQIFRGALALAVGLIVGLQRESKASSLAGIRTFALFCLSGFFAALLERSGIPFAFAASLLTCSAIVVTGMILEKRPEKKIGLTTEIAALVIFLIGSAFVYSPDVRFAVVAGGTCALLLHLKESMHGFVGRMNKVDLQAIMQFVLIAFVILPLLPDETFDNYGVLSPKKIWLMVVLITGISLVSYTVQKIKAGSAGTLWTGILGGLISSTATTVTLSRFSSKAPEVRTVIPALMIASTVAFVRVLFEILVVSPETFRSIVVPLSLLFIFMILLSGYSYFRIGKETVDTGSSEDRSPAQLKAAIVFGLLFAVILYLSAWARTEFGDEGLYGVSLVSGLIDVDAITLSTAQLVEQKQIGTQLGWRLIMVAFLSNLFFKGMIVAGLARGVVRRRVLTYFGISVTVGVLILLFA